MSRFAIPGAQHASNPAAEPPLPCRWYIPCIALMAGGCLIPLPLHPVETRVPEIQNPIPEEGAVELHQYDEDPTITASVFDRDTVVWGLGVIWSVGDDNVTSFSEKYVDVSDTPDEEPHRITVVLHLDYEALSDHDQDVIELWVSDGDDEVTAEWVLTVLEDQ